VQVTVPGAVNAYLDHAETVGTLPQNCAQFRLR
jgi:hypothetical protein